MDMRTMRMEREDIENSLKVLSHIVDDDFIITVDEARKIIRIDGETIEALQAEVERLKDCNDELREAQTYIDHYGDRWMTSAKDVPSSAYEHGYADGRDEAEAHLPKRGEWIYHPKDAIEMMFTLPKCSICGHESSDALNYCPNCGAKMETQDENISKFADGEWWKEARNDKA